MSVNSDYLWNFPPFREMGENRLRQGCAFYEPARSMNEGQMRLISQARLDAMIRFAGGEAENPYTDHVDRLAWAGVVDAELQDLATHGEPVRRRAQR